MISGKGSVTVQRAVRLSKARRGFIDLELDFGDGHLVWVEIKLRSPESGPDQLEKYQQALARLGGKGRLILLIPADRRAEFPHLGRIQGGTRGSLLCDTWQDIYDKLDTWRSQQRGRVRWFVSEILDYMKEAQLMSTPLKPKHVQALQTVVEADGALSRIIDEVHEQLPEEMVGRRDDMRSKRLHDLAYRELRYTAARPSPWDGTKTRGSARRVWGVDLSDPAFFAGVVFDRRGKLASDQHWRDAFTSDTGWQSWSDRDEEWRYRTRALKDLMDVGRTRQDQIKLVRTFVCDAFKELDDSRR